MSSNIEWSCHVGLHVPQTVGEEMKVANEEVDYEKTVENEYGLYPVLLKLEQNKWITNLY